MLVLNDEGLEIFNFKVVKFYKNLKIVTVYKQVKMTVWYGVPNPVVVLQFELHHHSYQLLEPFTVLQCHKS